ncbi:MAG: hypothetical protein H6618_04070 [Deltaproteobacteria bacterium]|nr:hypothetical protein [Deltaproteobacteria bacterium]
MWIDDEMLMRCHEDRALSVWVPEYPMVVLGSSNRVEEECLEEACLRDGIPLLKRYGGGGTVLLHPGCVVLSLGLWTEHPYRNDRYFSMINQALAGCLLSRWPELEGIEERGISDLAIGGKKIAGTSLFRSRHYLLYQASVLVEPRAQLMGRYLAHPGREPEYRQGRSHEDFVSGLSLYVPALSPHMLCQELEQHFMEHLQEDEQSRLLCSQPSQWPHILRRAAQHSAFVSL